MTNQQRGPYLSLAFLWAQLDEKGRTEGLKNIAARGQEYFDTLMESAMDALGLVTPPPAERLAYYYVKTPMEWEEQRQKYPADFEHEQADFQRLRERELKGDLVAAQMPQQGVMQ